VTLNINLILTLLALAPSNLTLTLCPNYYILQPYPSHLVEMIIQVLSLLAALFRDLLLRLLAMGVYLSAASNVVVGYLPAMAVSPLCCC